MSDKGASEQPQSGNKPLSKQVDNPYAESAMDIISTMNAMWVTSIPNPHTGETDYWEADKIEEKLDLMGAKINELVRLCNRTNLIDVTDLATTDKEPQ